MRIVNDATGEILVMRDPSRACLEIHIKAASQDEYRVVRLVRAEARRLAALLLFQAERLESGQRGLRLPALRAVEP